MVKQPDSHKAARPGRKPKQRSGPTFGGRTPNRPKIRPGYGPPVKFNSNQNNVSKFQGCSNGTIHGKERNEICGMMYKTRNAKLSQKYTFTNRYNDIRRVAW